jgi:hypothetical protein
MKGTSVNKGYSGSDLYEIRIRGQLDGRWADWFGGMTIALEDNGDTTMTGPIVDQAALHGMLKKVRDLGMPLLSVNCVGDEKTLIQGKEKKMTTDRKTAMAVGVLYIVGTAAGVACLGFTGALRNAQDTLALVAANGSSLIVGAALYLTMGLVLAMVPVLLFPILRRQNEGLALGYVIFRGGLETVSTMVGAVSWLLLLPLSHVYSVGSPDASTMRTLGTVLLDAGAIGSIGTIVFGIGALMLNFLLFRSRLVPRWISAWGFLAALPYLAGGILALTGMMDPLSTVTTILDMPTAFQEMVLAVWLIAKGFNPTAIASQPARQTSKAA